AVAEAAVVPTGLEGVRSPGRVEGGREVARPDAADPAVVVLEGQRLLIRGTDLGDLATRVLGGQSSLTIDPGLGELAVRVPLDRHLAVAAGEHHGPTDVIPRRSHLLVVVVTPLHTNDPPTVVVLVLHDRRVGIALVHDRRDRPVTAELERAIVAIARFDNPSQFVIATLLGAVVVPDHGRIARLVPLDRVLVVVLGRVDADGTTGLVALDLPTSFALLPARDVAETVVGPVEVVLVARELDVHEAALVVVHPLRLLTAAVHA